MSKNWKAELEAALAAEDYAAVKQAARDKVSRVLRFLSGRLYLNGESEKWKTIHALGAVAADQTILDHQRATELMRRFVWALNDESGAVPYGIPEAIGEVLAVRPELQEAFLPILCSLLTEEEMSQTGPVERGALWAVGRVGRPAAEYSEEAVTAVREAAASHPDSDSRDVARKSLASMMGETPL